MKLVIGEIIKIESVNVDIFKMHIKFEERFDFKVGQFINIKASDFDQPFLRRPISISRRINEKTIEILVKEIGVGTRILREKIVGSKLDIIGPIGNGFNLKDLSRDSKILIVGGGIGIAPLRGLFQKLSEMKISDITVVNGFRDNPFGEEDFICSKYFEINEEIQNQFVTEYLKENINFNEFDMIYSCGPKLMLKEISKIARAEDVIAQISLEEKMACGIGVCLGCAIKIKTDDFIYTYKKVCVDGPVFLSSEVIFDE